MTKVNLRVTVSIFLHSARSQRDRYVLVPLTKFSQCQKRLSKLCQGILDAFAGIRMSFFAAFAVR